MFWDLVIRRFHFAFEVAGSPEPFLCALTEAYHGRRGMFIMTPSPAIFDRQILEPFSLLLLTQDSYQGSLLYRHAYGALQMRRVADPALNDATLEAWLAAARPLDDNPFLSLAQQVGCPVAAAVETAASLEAAKAATVEAAAALETAMAEAATAAVTAAAALEAAAATVEAAAIEADAAVEAATAATAAVEAAAADAVTAIRAAASTVIAAAVVVEAAAENQVGWVYRRRMFNFFSRMCLTPSNQLNQLDQALRDDFAALWRWHWENRRPPAAFRERWFPPFVQELFRNGPGGQWGLNEIPTWITDLDERRFLVCCPPAHRLAFFLILYGELDIRQVFLLLWRLTPWGQRRADESAEDAFHRAVDDLVLAWTDVLRRMHDLRQRQARQN